MWELKERFLRVLFKLIVSLIKLLFIKFGLLKYIYFILMIICNTCIFVLIILPKLLFNVYSIHIYIQKNWYYNLRANEQ